MNIVSETKDFLELVDKNIEDIKWVGSADGEYAISWGEFANKFKDIKYDNGYGSQEIANDLVVVGSDWWLERSEYDGSERWEYKKPPVKKEHSKTFDKILGDWEPISIIMEKINE